MNRNAVRVRVREIICGVFDFEDEDLTDDTNFFADLGVRPGDFIEFITIEEEFDIKLSLDDEEEFKSLVTVNDLTSFVHKRIADPSPA
jgi:acyl carrier protein